MKKNHTERGQGVIEFLLVIVSVTIVLVIMSMVYGQLELSKHAREAHAGEAWQADDIATYFDSCKPTVRCIDGTIEVHYCEYNGSGLGLIIDTIKQTIITGFQARLGYWKNCK